MSWMRKKVKARLCNFFFLAIFIKSSNTRICPLCKPSKVPIVIAVSMFLGNLSTELNIFTSLNYIFQLLKKCSKITINFIHKFS